MKLYPCEFCNEVKLPTLDDTVCIDCDRMMIQQQASVIPAPAARTCRGCSDPLTSARYFYCLRCDAEPDSESVFDAADSIDFDSEVREPSAKLIFESKACSRCTVVKVRSEYNKCSRTRDGRLPHCRTCQSLDNAATARRRREQSLINKAARNAV